MVGYPVTLTTDGDHVLVDFRDFPAHTYGDDQDEALARAVDALTTIIGAYMRDRQPIPRPATRARGRYGTAAPVDGGQGGAV